MALYSAGYLSPIKNKLGNAVGRRWRNLDVLAAYRGTISNPRTAAQQLQRAKFKTLSNLARVFAPIVNQSMKESSAGTKRFPRALFMHLNKEAITGSTASNVGVNYSGLKISAGNMLCAVFGAPTFNDPNTVRVPMDASNISAAYPGDISVTGRCRVVVYCPQAGYYVANGSDLSDSSVAVNVPTNWNGLAVQVYAYCYIGEGDYPDYGLKAGDCSESVYCGTGTIQ